MRWQCVLKSLFLFPAKSNRLAVLTIYHANAQTYVVAGANLIDQPSYTVRIVGFVAGHRSIGTEYPVARFGDRVFERPVLLLIVPVWYIMRICTYKPRALFTLHCSF